MASLFLSPLLDKNFEDIDVFPTETEADVHFQNLNRVAQLGAATVTSPSCGRILTGRQFQIRAAHAFESGLEELLSAGQLVQGLRTDREERHRVSVRIVTARGGRLQKKDREEEILHF